jgi:hypothetical protein
MMSPLNQQELFERIKQPGTAASIGSQIDRAAIAMLLLNLLKEGHAVMADEITEGKEETGRLRVYHYLSCNKCKQTRKE